MTANLGENEFLFTSESVTEGHPDKIADQISDAVLDAALAVDPYSRVACETMLTTGLALVAGEITTSALLDIPEIVRSTIRNIGYTPACGFDGDACAVLTALDKQSPDISQGVDMAHEARHALSDSDLDRVGAGDQGMMFGYATSETPELMPMPIALAHRLARQLARVRKSGQLPFLRPDGKTQVTVRYRDGVPVAVEKVLISAQHEDGSENRLAGELWDNVVLEAIPASLYDAAGLGPGDLDCVEVHDAAASAELMIYEQLSLAEPGAGAALIRSGDAGLGGRLPVNTSGGLLARGHPIGATGLAQIVEVVLQLRSAAGDRQVPRARVALTQNAGGWHGADNVASVIHIFGRRAA